MSCCSINNIARVIDVRQVAPVDTLKPINDTLQCTPVNYGTVETAKKSIGTNRELVTTLSGLFASFFSQLISLLSDKKDTTVPDIPPPPRVQPEVPPRVIPEPLPPKPEVAANIPGLSIKRNGAKPDNIWSGFRQGPSGNCVTVSAIKAAMYRFGQSPTDIFRSVRKEPGGYHVVMHDDFQLRLTDSELAQAAQGSRFIGPDKEMLKDAQFLFAVSAKRAQMEDNDGTASRSFHAALRSLNNGEAEWGPGEGFLRLGLRKHMRTVPVSALAGGQVGMCNRDKHSVAVINGREELWGRRGSAPTYGHAVALM